MQSFILVLLGGIAEWEGIVALFNIEIDQICAKKNTCLTHNLLNHIYQVTFDS